MSIHDQPKKCNHCKETKPRTEFRYSKKSKQYCFICKPCENKHRASRQKQNIESYRARWSVWAWRPEVREKIRRTAREQYQKRKDKCRVYVLNRIARLRNADGKFTAKQIQEMLARQDWKCKACKSNVSNGYHIDHIKPLFDSGSNDISNIQILCPTCNMRKGRKPMDEFMKLLEVANG